MAGAAYQVTRSFERESLGNLGSGIQMNTRGKTDPRKSIVAAMTLMIGCLNSLFSAHFTLGMNLRHNSPKDNPVKIATLMSYAKTVARKLNAGVEEYGCGCMARTGPTTMMVVNTQCIASVATGVFSEYIEFTSALGVYFPKIRPSEKS